MSGNRRRLGRRPLADHSPRKNSSALDLTGRQTKAHMDRRQLTVLVQDKERQKATTSQLREPFRRSAGALSVIIPGCDRICMPNSDRCYNRCGGALGVAGASGVSDQYGYAHAGPHEDRCSADLPQDDVMDIDYTQDNDDLDSKDEDLDVVRALCRVPAELCGGPVALDNHWVLLQREIAAHRNSFVNQSCMGRAIGMPSHNVNRSIGGQLFSTWPTAQDSCTTCPRRWWSSKFFFSDAETHAQFAYQLCGHLGQLFSLSF